MLDFTKLRNAAGGWRASFEELVCQLGRAIPPEDAAGEFCRIEGAGGDGGIEALWTLPNGDKIGYQAKFHERSADINWQALDRSIATAMETHPRLVKIIVAIACDLTGKTAKRRGRPGWEHWENHREKWQQQAQQKKHTIEFELWTASNIEQLLTQPQAAGLLEYWFNEKLLSQDWFAEKFKDTKQRLGERYNPDDNVEVEAQDCFQGLRRAREWRARLTERLSAVAEKTDYILPSQSETTATNIAKLNKIVGDLVAREDEIKLPVDKSFPSQQWLENIERAYESLSIASEGIQEDIDAKVSTKTGAKPDLEPERNPRHQLTKLRGALNLLYDTLESPAQQADSKHLLYVTGRAGTGKSHLLASQTEAAIAADEPAILLLGTDFELAGDPAQQILVRLDLQRDSFDSFEKFLGMLSAAAYHKQCRALFSIDAINESSNAQLWREKLPSLIDKALQYPNIVLCISCREEFVDYLLTDSAKQRGQAIRIEGYKTAQEREQAARIHFDKRGIVRPASHWTSPEFTNPLFFRTACETLKKKGQSEFPRGLRGTQALLRFYLEGVALTLHPDYSGRGDLINPLYKAALDIAAHMAQARVDYIERGTATPILDKAFRGYNPPLSLAWLDALVRNSVLREDIRLQADSYDVFAEDTKVYRFTFQRFQDHLIAEALLKDVDAPDGLFNEKDGALNFILGRYQLDFAWRGVYQALAIQFADKWQVEIADHLPKELVGEWYGNDIEDAFIESVRWRSKDAFTKRTEELLNELYHEYGLSLLLELALVEEHPWNADFLHTILARHALPERDALWTLYVNIDDDINEAEETIPSPAVHIIDWALGSGIEHASDEVVRLALISLGWMFASTNGRVRDRATKAATELLLAKPAFINDFLYRFAKVDDIYVIERVLAAIAGACLRQPDPTILKQASHAIWRTIFESGNPPPHILLRDYARIVIDLANAKNALPTEVDYQHCLPPYRSTPPAFSLDEKQIEVRAKSVGANEISFSCQPHGDFGRYVVENKTRNFTLLPIAEPMPTRAENKKLPRLDSGQAQSWILQRTLELGWTKELFPYDRNRDISRTHRASRTERIGKKYQWIAFYELLARLADNYWLASEWGDSEARVYDSPLDISYTRNIEPTLPVQEKLQALASDGATNSTLPSIPSLLIEDVAPANMKAWVFDEKIPSARLRLGLCEDIAADGWVALYRNASADIRNEGDKYALGNPFQQMDFHMITAIAVPKKKRANFVRQAVHAKVNIRDWVHMTNDSRTDSLFLYEIGLRETKLDEEWEVTNDWRGNPGLDYLSFSCDYHWESTLDGSLPEGFGLRVPNAWLIRALNLCADTHHPGIYRDSSGIPVTVSATADNNIYCLIRRDYLYPLLEERGLVLLWAGTGMRDACPDPAKNAGPRRLWNGLLWAGKREVPPEIWCEDYGK